MSPRSPGRSISESADFHYLDSSEAIISSMAQRMGETMTGPDSPVRQTANKRMSGLVTTSWLVRDATGEADRVPLGGIAM